MGRIKGKSKKNNQRGKKGKSKTMDQNQLINSVLDDDKEFLEFSIAIPSIEKMIEENFPITEFDVETDIDWCRNNLMCFYDKRLDAGVGGLEWEHAWSNLNHDGKLDKKLTMFALYPKEDQERFVKLMLNDIKQSKTRLRYKKWRFVLHKEEMRKIRQTERKMRKLKQLVGSEESDTSTTSSCEETNKEADKSKSSCEERRTSKEDEDLIHKIKVIEFNGRFTPIILQGGNGPCALLAICNVLLLKNDLQLDEGSTEISQQLLLSRVFDELNKSKTDNKDAENITDAIPCLAIGTVINIKFNGITEFEYTRGRGVFDLLKIPLYHGWIVDPKTRENKPWTLAMEHNTILTVVRCLIKILDKTHYISDNRLDIQRLILSILSRARYDVCGDVIKQKLIPHLVQFVSDPENGLAIWGGKGIPLIEVFNMVYLGRDKLKPWEQYGSVKLTSSVGVQYLYYIAEGDVDLTNPSIKHGDDLVVTVKGPTCYIPDEIYNLEFDLFSSTYNDTVDILWPAQHLCDGTAVNLKERRMQSSDGTSEISVWLGLFPNAAVANLEVKLLDNFAGLDVYGVVVASNSELYQSNCASVLFAKKASGKIKLGTDGVIPLSKSCVAVPLNSSLSVDISLHVNGVHHKASLSLDAKHSGDSVAHYSRARATFKVSVKWNAKMESVYSEYNYQYPRPSSMRVL